MGKLFCDSATVTESLTPQSPPSTTWRDLPPLLPSTVDISSTSWDDVSGLEDQQRKNLSRLQAKGVLWTHPDHKSGPPVVFRLTHGGDVASDGNCLFTAFEKSASWGLRESNNNGGECSNCGARELRQRTVERFKQDFESAEKEEKERVELVIKNLYSPDLESGWGIHFVQEVKLLAKKSDRQILDDAILELTDRGMLRYILSSFMISFLNDCGSFHLEFVNYYLFLFRNFLDFFCVTVSRVFVFLKEFFVHLFFLLFIFLFFMSICLLGNL